jgi:hypothetical protein
MEELHEAVTTLDDVQELLDDLAVSGLRTVVPATLARLRGYGEEFGQIGAEHLSEQLGRLVSSIEADDRAAAEDMVRLQTSLRMFERILALEAASASLQYILEPVADDDAIAEEESL